MYNTLMSASIETKIQDLLQQNQRTHEGLQFTVPAADLYPFQWLWDSCFHAIIYAHFDVTAAQAELTAVCSRPLASGLLPHIIYHKQLTTTPSSWGREQRGGIIDAAWGVSGTSSLTQPCVIALAARKVHDQSNDRTWLASLYPTLYAHFDALAHEYVARRYAPLLTINNPDESGEDNSPRFDSALGLPPQHSADIHLDVRLKLMQQYATCGYAVATCMHEHFAVIDFSFNALYAMDLAELATIATYLGHHDDALVLNERSAAVKTALRKHLWNGNYFLSLDLRTGNQIPTLTWTVFMALYAGLLSADEAEELISSTLLNPTHFKSTYGLPTTAKSEVSYDPHAGFWRGPVWHAPHWFLYHGLMRYAKADLAAEYKAASRALIVQSGFREQYHPDTGAGQGATDFTWGGLVLDMV